MPTYLIVKKTGEGELDFKPCAVIRGRTADEVDQAIQEGATEGAGDYRALSLDSAVERRITLEPTVGPVPDSD